MGRSRSTVEGRFSKLGITYSTSSDRILQLCVSLFLLCFGSLKSPRNNIVYIVLALLVLVLFVYPTSPRNSKTLQVQQSIPLHGTLQLISRIKTSLLLEVVLGKRVLIQRCMYLEDRMLNINLLPKVLFK